MSDAMAPLRDHEGFKSLLVSFSRNPILGVLAGFVLTAIIKVVAHPLVFSKLLPSQGPLIISLVYLPLP